MAWQDDPVTYSNGHLTRTWNSTGLVQDFQKLDLYQQIATGAQWGWISRPTAPAVSIAPAAVAASTGVNPVENSYSLFGHTIPLSYGSPRIGGEIIAGPWISNGLASFCISFGVPFDPSDTRTLLEIAFDSEVVWTAAGGFNTEAFTYRFYGGTLTQAADPLEISHFGANAVAYRPQILLWFENLPLAGTKFGKIPYVAARFVDSTGGIVNFGTAFQTLAYSPWVGYTSAQFETVGITDGVTNGGFVFAQQADFLTTIQQFGRFYPNWDILQTDKLRIVDRGSTVTADITLDATRLLGNVTVARQGQDTVRKDLELSTIDPDADYTIVPSVAQRPRNPVAVTTSVGKDSAYLPVIMDSPTRTAIVTFAKYHEEAIRKTISGTAMAYGLQMEPGALARITGLGDDFNNETFKIVESEHGANYTVAFTAAAILKCGLGTGACPVDIPATFDPVTVHNATLSGGNLTVTNTGSSSTDQGARTATAQSSCKYYFELAAPTAGGGFREGHGIMIPTGNYTAFGGNGGGGVWLETGTGSTNIFSNNTGIIYTTGVSAAFTICWAIDLDNRLAWVRNPGGNWNGQPTANPSTLTGGVAIPAGAMQPACTFGGFGGSPGRVLTANFGGSAFVAAVPTGYGPGWPV